MNDICNVQLKVRLERDIVALRCCTHEPLKTCYSCPFRSFNDDCLKERRKQLTIDLALSVEVLEKISRR